MFTSRRLDVALLAVVVSLILLRHAAGPTPAQADPQTAPASGLQQACGEVPGTPFFSEYYGTVTLDGGPASAGTVVEAYSPRGNRAGCVQVTVPGYYPYLRVYREDLDANPPIPGMKPGDEVTFKVNGQVAQTDPSPVIWTDDLNQHQVNLSAMSGPCYDLDGSTKVDAGDFAVMAGVWRATDAASLNLCDFNKNDIVDVGDFMTLATHFGETSCTP